MDGKVACVRRAAPEEGFFGDKSAPLRLGGVILGVGLPRLCDGLGGPLEGSWGDAPLALQGLIVCSGLDGCAGGPGHRRGTCKGCMTSIASNLCAGEAC